MNTIFISHVSWKQKKMFLGMQILAIPLNVVLQKVFCIDMPINFCSVKEINME